MRSALLKLLVLTLALAFPLGGAAQVADQSGDEDEQDPAGSEGDDGSEDRTDEDPTAEPAPAPDPAGNEAEEPSPEAAEPSVEPDGDDGGEVAPANDPPPEGEPPAVDQDPAPEEPAAPMSAADLPILTARVLCAGRVGAGLLVADGQAVITPLDMVQLGYPVEVRLGDGHLTRGHITAVDAIEGLARVELDEPAPDAPTTPLRRRAPELGEHVAIVGHGGATGMSDLYQVEREMLTFSVIHARVASAPVELDDLTPAEQPRRFLVDRSLGVGDAGSPIFDQEGQVLGLLLEEVKDGGGRSIAVGAATLDDLVAEPELEKPWRKRHHLQSWGGLGLVAHNRPSHLAGAILYGLRVVLLDSIRLEPWLEVDLGTRAARAAEGDLSARPRDFWWSVETGLTVGYRIPMFVEGGRNYIIPTAGFRIGWNRFQHKVDELVSSCDEGDAGGCGFVLERSIDQERSLRPGIDVGIDVRHGKVRFGYRFFIDPMAVRTHSMHRLVVTFDGLLLPIKVGDSN